MHRFVYLFFLFPFLSNWAYGQINPLDLLYQNESAHLKAMSQSLDLVNDTTYDVKHYDLDLSVALDSQYLQGVASILIEIVQATSSIQLDFKDYYTVDEVGLAAESYALENDELTLVLDQSYPEGALVEVLVTYSGIPQLESNTKGLRYENHNGNELIIATLSTPFLAHTWYPCKDGPEDKADSVFVSVTIKDTTIAGIQLVAVSNGLLKEVTSENNFNTYHWEHRYPIVPYYVMVAISNYASFSETYVNGSETFPLDYYVFENNISDAQSGVEDLPLAMDLFTDLFGPYPFASEKYGMTQLGFYGGIENQTNAIVGNMDAGWFYVSVHELAHMWFADNITCSNWHHGWLNEGFATYSEALWAEAEGGFEAYQNKMVSKEFWAGGTLYLQDIDDPFQIFIGIIYNKGAWTLHMLRGILGDEVFFQALLNYSTNSSFSYGHATTEDLQAVFESESGLDLDYFFEQWVYEEYYPKYRYNYVYDSEEQKLHLAVNQTQGQQGWLDVFTMPIQVRLTFADGTEAMHTIFNDQQEQTFVIETSKTVIDVDFDPEKWILRKADFDSSIPVGLTESIAHRISISPNPVSDHLQINGLENKQVSLVLSDLNGRLIRTVESTRMDVSDLDPGVYFLIFQVDNQRVKAERVVKL